MIAALEIGSLQQAERVWRGLADAALGGRQQHSKGSCDAAAILMARIGAPRTSV